MHTRTGTTTHGGRDRSVVFQVVASALDSALRDNISATNFAQAYAGTNRYRTNSAGNLELVPANTPVIDHIGASLTPALRMEPAGASLLLGNPPVTQDITLPTGSFTLQVWDAVGTATVSAGTATITGAGAASKGTPVTFVVTVAGTVTITIDTAILVKLELGAIPSSYFAGAAAIGNELVANGDFSAVVESAPASSGLFIIGNCYKIVTRTDGNFIGAGAPDNNPGTYFNATTTGAGVLDAGDTASAVALANWTAGAGWAPQATAGALTGKAQKIAGTASYLSISIGAGALLNKVGRNSCVVTVSAGAAQLFFGGTGGPTTISASGTYYDYIIGGSGATIAVYGASTFAGTVDDFSSMEHGTVRISESNTITLATPAAVSTALAATGTLVTRWMPSWAKASGIVVEIISSEDGAAASLLYIASGNGQLSSYDSTTVATSAAVYTANAWTKIALQWPSDTNKYKVGADVNAGGIVYGSEAAFDGAFLNEGTLRIGYVLHGPMWIQWIKIYNKLITPAQVNALN